MSCSPRRSSGPGSRNTSAWLTPSSLVSSSSTCSSMFSCDLQAHRRAEPAPQQLLLQRLEEVLRVVLLDLEVLVAGDPEGVDAEHLHAGEEPLEVLADDVLERHEPLVAQGHEPAEDRRHLDPGEVLLVGLGVAHQHGEVEREPGDVGERVRRVDGQRREHREDALLEQLLAGALLVAVEVVPADELDVLLAQRRDDLLGEHLRVPRHQVGGLVPDLLEHLAGHQPGGGADGDAGGDAALEAGHADHEELVEVAGEDRQEPHPLEQRQAVVLGELEHALVEPQPGELPVEEPVLELAGRERHLVGVVGRVHVEDVGRGPPAGPGRAALPRRRTPTEGW